MRLEALREGADRVSQLTERDSRAGQNGRPVEAKLLVVDDEPNIVELLSASLRYAGFAVSTATSGVDAVNAARRDRPDLVLLDVMLPDMDGFDVLRKLRSGSDRVPVVFLTARDATEDKIAGLTLGGDDYVVKPFSLEEVLAGCGQCCDAPAAAATPSAPAC